MYCTKCGNPRVEGAASCPNCGEPYAMYAQPVAPLTVPNYLVQSILVTLCCCLPLGIVAIIFATQVDGKLAAGDLTGAMEASSKAKLFSWIGFGGGILLGLGYGLLVFFGAISRHHF